MLVDLDLRGSGVYLWDEIFAINFEFDAFFDQRFEKLFDYNVDQE
jgi:hypothetical protein